MIPKVLVTFSHRPMSAGLFFGIGMRQAGCNVLTAGPAIPEVYGYDNWGDDFRPPDIEIPNEPMGVNSIVTMAKARGFTPDAVLTIDQYDWLVVTGQPDGFPWAHVAIENFNGEQAQRAELRKATAEFHCIEHHDGLPPGVRNPSPPAGSEWITFGADPFIHPNLGWQRDFWVCQIGTHYEPRPTIWNTLREYLEHPGTTDRWAPEDYNRGAFFGEHCIFGRIPNYRGMAEAYNRSLCAISCSNSDFVPMRAPEAFAMGSILLSDDVPSMVKAYGLPAMRFGHLGPCDSGGIWLAHDRTAEGMAAAVEWVVKNPAEASAIRTRASAFVCSGHYYYHRARQILKRLGIVGAGRMI